jgi:hypothetical protein
MFNGDAKIASAEDALVALSNTDRQPLKMRRWQWRDQLNESSMRHVRYYAALQ